MPKYDFAVGSTNPETFPTELFAEAAAAAIRKSGPQLSFYPGGYGNPELRAQMAERESTREGVPVNPEHIALMHGSMQGVTVVADYFRKHNDDIVIMEEFSYSGTISAFKGMGYKMIGMPVDNEGMRMDALEECLAGLHREHRPPRFIYTLATYQNPTGTVMPKARRLELVEIATRYNCVLVEDNCYGDVHYDGDKEPALYTLDPRPESIYIGSLSKIFAPGVRVGYLYARPPMLQKLVGRRFDCGPNSLAAAIMAEYLRGRMWQHIEMANTALKEKRDATMEALDASLGNLCQISQPAGGLFIWIRLPDDVDRERLAQLAEERSFGYAKGSSFHVHNADVPFLRLAFGHIPTALIREGIPVLASCIRDARRTNAAAVQ